VGAMSFTEALWRRVEEPVFREILRHPFVAGLTSGELEERRFRHYVVQDSLYLKDFGRGLAMLAARSEDEEALMMFAEHAKVTVVVEEALHESFLGSWGMTKADVAASEPAPACLLYTSFLLRTVHTRPFYEALGAFLPCYWVYWEVGKALVERGSPNELYQRWIDTYAGEEFARTVRDMLALVERTCAPLTGEQREAVAAHFVQGCRLEWMFWDMGYREETWPVG